MTTTETPKSPRNVTKWIWQIAFLVIMLAVVRLLWMRTQPEMLADTSGIGSSDIISGDHLYRLVNNSNLNGEHSEAAIYAVPLHSGGTRKISREEARWQVAETNVGQHPFSIMEGEIFYGLTPFVAPSAIALFGAPSGSIGMARQTYVNLGTFLMPARNPSAKETAEQKRAVLAYPASPNVVRFRRVPLIGGQPRDAATLRCERYCLVGSSVFWIRPKPETTVQITPGPGAHNRNGWTEVTAHSDLMLTSLLDNTTHCIRAGVPSNTVLIAEASGVHWTEPALFPNPPTFFYASVADGSVRTLGNVEANQFLRSVVEMAGRCYWAIDLPPNPAAPSVGWELRSAKLDGTDRRVVFSQVANHPVISILPYVYQGNLYCLYNGKGNGTAYQETICRVHPDRSDPIEILRTLPKGMSGFQFDGGYLYGTKSETHRGAWETMTNDNVNDTSSTTLCRIPLK